MDACSALNIITGFENGKFVPNDNVTREQTAKMICVLLNGGKEPVLGSAASSFTDVANDRWSCPYIESCVSQDIVVGVGGGKFAPTGKVTGSQLAKMLLVALGFSPDHQKYAGSAWEVNVNTDASARGFYKDLEDINPSEPLTREHAAQMIWNALNAYEVEYKSVLSTDANGQLTSKTTVQDKVVGDNNDKITLLQDKYGIAIVKGVLANVQKNANKDTYSIDVKGVTGYTYIINDRPYEGNTTSLSNAFANVDKDYSAYLGQEVKIMIKSADKVGDDATITGIYATDNNTVVTAVKDDMKDLETDKATINGETYKPDTSITEMNDVPVWYTPGNLRATADTTVGGLADWQTLTLIDNNGDGKIDLGICTPVAFAEISTLTDDELNLSEIAGATLPSKDLSYDLEDDDVNLYDGAAEDDYVIVVQSAYTVDDTAVITKADMVTGSVDAQKGSITDVKVDGSWYTVINYPDPDGKTHGLKLNKAFDMATLGSFVFAADKDTSAATVEDVLFVDVAEALDTGVGKRDKKVEATVYFTTGDSETVTISKIYPADSDTSVKAQDWTGGAPALENKMWMFEKDGSDYVLTQLMDQKETLSFDGYVASALNGLKDGKVGTWSGDTFTTDSTNNLRVDNDSVVFVKVTDPKNGDTDVKVVDGKSVAGWSDANGKTVSGISALYDKSNGYGYITVGAVLLNTASVPGTSDYHYGYVLEEPEVNKVDGTYYTIATIWDGTSDTVTVTGKAAIMGKVDKGTFIQYTLDSEGKVDTINVQTLANAKAVTKFDDTSVNGIDYDDDYVAIGVNTKDIAKSSNTKIKKAEDGINNVVYFLNDDGDKIAAIFVAHNNKMISADQIVTVNVDESGKTFMEGSTNYTTQNNLTWKFTANETEYVVGETVKITGTIYDGNGDAVDILNNYTYSIPLTGGGVENAAAKVTVNESGQKSVVFTYKVDKLDGGKTLTLGNTVTATKTAS